MPLQMDFQSIINQTLMVMAQQSLFNPAPQTPPIQKCLAVVWVYCTWQKKYFTERKSLKKG